MPQFDDQAVGDHERFCGVADRIGGNICRWDNTNWDGQAWIGTPKTLELTWGLGPVPANIGVDRATIEAVIIRAFEAWSKVCAVSFKESTSNNEADILFKFAAIDGQSGTLADMHLPCGKDGQLNGRIDKAERWYWGDGKKPTGTLYAQDTIEHEIGHALGMGHSPDGVKSKMAPFENGIRELQEWEIKQARLRYGDPLPKDSPSEPLPPEFGQVTVTIGGQKYTGTLSPV